MFVKICGTTIRGGRPLWPWPWAPTPLASSSPPRPARSPPSRLATSPSACRSEILTVGVFRDEAPQRVVDICQSAGLRAAQLHGNETARADQWVRRRLRMVIKAFPAGSVAAARAKDYGADAILLDSPHPGSGQVFDWAFAQRGADRARTLIIAGGLTADNVAAAIARTEPWGVDVVTRGRGVAGAQGPGEAAGVYGRGAGGGPGRRRSPRRRPLRLAGGS